MKRQKQTTALPQPYVHPSVDPAVANYQRDQLDRSRYHEQVAGGPTPPIPRLDADASEGMTMADQATAARMRQQQVAAQTVPMSNPFSSPPQPPPQQPQQFSRPPVGVLPQDILPEAATQDPAYREGPGSRYASSQPELARKYGVLRNGQLVPPQQLQTGKPGLSPETVAGLKAIEEFNAVREKAESPEASVEAESAASTAGAAARLGETSKPTNAEVAERALSQMDDFDFNTFRDMMMRDIINNEDQRKIVEERLEPLDLTSLIMEGRVRQRVPIVPGKFEPEFQSMSGDEDLALKRLLMTEAAGLDVNSRYLLDKFSLMSVAVGLYAVNRTVLPDHRDADGRFDDKAFLTKFKKVLNFPFHMLSSLGVHYFWFDVRVRKLFVAEKLGNG